MKLPKDFSKGVHKKFSKKKIPKEFEFATEIHNGITKTKQKSRNR